MIRLLSAKPFVRSLFVALSLPSLSAMQAEPEASGPKLTVTTERSDAAYKINETVTFLVRFTREGKPVDSEEIEWTLSKDGAAPINTGMMPVKNGEAKVTGTLGEAGFLQCSVVVKEGKEVQPQPALGGAAVEPLGIKPSLPAPDDFDAFWVGKKAELAQVPLNIQKQPVPSNVKDVAVFDVQADCVGAPVSGYLARPADAKPKSLPAILTLHGAGVYDSRMSTAILWAKNRFLALDINAHGLPNGKPKEFYDQLYKGDFIDYKTRGRESRDTFYFLGMFLRVVRAIDVLAAQPEWDGRILVIQGNSQGGAQAIAGAGLDPRVTFLAAGVPAMCDHSGMIVDRVAGWPKLVPVDTEKQPNRQMLETARYYDMINFAARVKAPAFFTVGFIDRTCPPTTVYAAYNAISAPKAIFNDLAAGHVNTPEAVERMRKAILDHAIMQKASTSSFR